MLNKKQKEDLQYYLDFLWTMTEKEIKARYKKAIFGFLWVFLNPLIQMIIIGIIFSFFIDIPNYFLFLFTGLLPWQFFSLSLAKTTPSFVYERTLLKKGNFPREAIPISLVLSNFFHFLASLAILVIFLFILYDFGILDLILLIIICIWLLILTIGMSLLTSTLNVKFRDINFFVKSLLILWFYATPILYDLSLIPNKLLVFFALNPLTSIFVLIRIVTLKRGMLNINLFTTNVIISILIIFIGIRLFQKQNKYFVDWL